MSEEHGFASVGSEVMDMGLVESAGWLAYVSVTGMAEKGKEILAI